MRRVPVGAAVGAPGMGPGIAPTSSAPLSELSSSLSSMNLCRRGCRPPRASEPGAASCSPRLRLCAAPPAWARGLEDGASSIQAQARHQSLSWSSLEADHRVQAPRSPPAVRSRTNTVAYNDSVLVTQPGKSVISPIDTTTRRDHHDAHHDGPRPFSAAIFDAYEPFVRR
jgi:hypothetical protein